MTDHWVFNASPLILLGKTGDLGWVPMLGEIVVPRGVAAEIFAGPPEDPAHRWLNSGEGAKLIQTDAEESDDLKAWDLGAGETAVLAWAIRRRDFEAVLDDAAARACATVFGVKRRGTLSLVALAKKRGLIGACRPVFERLQLAGLYVSPNLIEQVARTVGE